MCLPQPFPPPLSLSAALAHSQLPTGAAVSFPSSLMVAVCGLLKPLIFHFPGSREAHAPSWPLVPPGFPKSGCTSQPGTHSQPVGPRRPAWPRHGHRVPNLPIGPISDPRNVKATGPPRVRCHPERLGHLPEDTRLRRGRGRASCLCFLVVCSLHCPPNFAAQL